MENIIKKDIKKLRRAQGGGAEGKGVSLASYFGTFTVFHISDVLPI